MAVQDTAVQDTATDTDSLLLLESETKYTLENARAPLVAAWLDARCHADPQYPSATVHSVYYDTRDFRSVREKQNSDYLKSKVRLRWYADADGKCVGNAFLEVKLRIGSRRQKHRVETEWPGAWVADQPLTSRDLLELANTLHTSGVHPGIRIEPALEVVYERRRYIEPATGDRLSLDSEIRVPRTNPNLLPPANPAPLRTAVFESKSLDGELAAGLRPLVDLGLRKSSFSKYASLFQHVTGVEI